MKYDENWTKDAQMTKCIKEESAIKHTLSDDAWKKIYAALAMQAILSEPHGMSAIWKKSKKENQEVEDIVAHDAELVAEALLRRINKGE